MSDQELETNISGANTRRFYYCYHCRRRIEALMAPSPTCPHCNEGFVEELGENDNDLIAENAGGQDSDDEPDETIHINPQNGQDFVQQLLQMFSIQPGPNVRVQTESRDGTTTITATTTGTRTTATEGGISEQQGEGRQDGNQHTHRPNIIFAMGSNAPNAGDERIPPLLNIAQMFQRILENGGTNNTNILNFFNIAGDPRDYAWGNSGWDNIISQLMDQQAGRQAPPPATDEIIENLPKSKITKKQVVEEQLGCPVCKDEFQIDEEAVYLPCTHTFHYDCIKPWLKMNGTCPVCRYSLVSQESNEQNAHNNNNGNRQNNGQQNQDEDFTELDQTDLD
ncbi:E3 ubiquitin-protein ligase RNF126 isoform X1 [Rhizophagus clarus]|uniref:RING-type E3 ubiquitin transferase n=1 Tax=Rhizophagus clarus TaxID=94130 RepID=A0A8H3L8T1_9GLOM|nr:E3 ubiquitin-protein ligase RNF126 isoform X1 [Rhizophagus clarus]